MKGMYDNQTHVIIKVLHKVFYFVNVKERSWRCIYKKKKIKLVISGF